MDRERIVEAIVQAYRAQQWNVTESVLRTSMKYVASDTNLISLAYELGVDVDMVLGGKSC